LHVSGIGLARRINPGVLILVASVVTGAAGYVVQILVAKVLGPVDYAPFAFFWSALYIVVGALGGVQQEVTRAASATARPGLPSQADRRNGRVVVFTLTIASIVFVVLSATSPLWAPLVFGPATGYLAWPLIVGAVSYVLVAGLSGALYGVKWWYPLVALIAVDGVLRLVGVLLALALSPSLAALAWAVAAPFPLAVIIVFPIVARKLRPSLDAGYAQLGRNVARTVVAAAATSALISGFPALLNATSTSVPVAVLGSLTFALTLTRAPIVIPLLALQSYLIVHFGSTETSLTRRVLRLEALAVTGAVVLGGLAALIGPTVLAFIRDDFVVSSWMFFVIVASSGLIAAMNISGPAALARSAHTAYTLGWVAASVVTIAMLLLPVEFDLRVSLALLVGPLLGCVVHLVGLHLAGRDAVA
jgi:O-antigen/teichoic acid export membrane protein